MRGLDATKIKLIAEAFAHEAYESFSEYYYSLKIAPAVPGGNVFEYKSEVADNKKTLADSIDEILLFHHIVQEFTCCNTDRVDFITTIFRLKSGIYISAYTSEDYESLGWRNVKFNCADNFQDAWYFGFTDRERRLFCEGYYLEPGN